MSPRPRPSLPLAALLLLAACESPIRTTEVGSDATYDYLNANAISSKGEVLGADTHLILSRFDLEEKFEEDPIAAIRQLHAIAVAQPSREILFSLAELSYAAAIREQRRDCYLAAAVYAWHYLVGTDSAAPPNPFDRRFRVACDAYNYGLLKALRSEDGERFLLTAGSMPLPVGKLDVRVTRPAFPWSQELFDEFIPADNLSVIGFSSRRRDAGIGVPLIAIRNSRIPGDALAANMPPRTSIPATALLRIEGKLADLEHGTAATLELYSAFDARTVLVGEKAVTLECDLTASLAHQLQRSKAWDFEIGAYLSGDDWADLAGLFLFQPYQRGKIPVIFVHGTASSPARWAEMFNQLNADADLRSSFQFWFFSYTTGDPTIYSASLLRDKLTELVDKLDPDGTDERLHEIVLIGHSQGGLISRLQTLASGDVFWKNLENSSIPMEAMTTEDREFLRHVLVFEPQPDVKRAIFLATPHHGSVFAGSWLGQFVRKLIGSPSHLLGKFKSLLSSESLREVVAEELPTSVDNMTPDHPFVLAYSSLEPASRVHSHSIIAVKGDGPPEGLDDGAVTYHGAHLDHVDSELVVRCGHSCQANPGVIEEVRRILLEHLKACGPPGR